MGTSGDKIVLLDGMGSGSGSAANGLLSMIPGMFTSLLGGNKIYDLGLIQRWRTLSAIEYRWGFFFVKYLIIVTFVRSRSFCS